MDGKLVQWMGSARDDLRDLPDEARRQLGFDVFQKKSHRTAPLDLELARTRYAALRRARTEG
jgi:phage-related protein